MGQKIKLVFNTIKIITTFLGVAVREGEALDALLRDVLQTGHAAGA